MKETLAEPPDLETLMRWKAEGICKAADGYVVELDGVCSHGHQSWLLKLGLVDLNKVEGKICAMLVRPLDALPSTS